MTDYEKKIEPIDIIQLECGELVSQEETKSLISKVPINVLFNPEGIQKRDVWDIDLIQILSMLLKIEFLLMHDDWFFGNGVSFADSCSL